MKKLTQSLLLLPVPLLLIILIASQAWGEDQGWKYALTPYLWMVGVDADLEVGGVATSADVSFSDIWDDLDIGGLLFFSASKNRWGIFADGQYLEISADESVAGIKIDIKTKFFLSEVGAAYRFGEPEQFFEVLGGGRYFYLRNELGISGGPSGSDSQDWLEPLVGGRFKTDLSDRWIFSVRGDIGGFGVGSDFTWQVIGHFGYHLSDRTSLALGYRHLDIDYDKGDFKFDGEHYGPLVGITFHF